jgi:hypothetical protein
MGMQKFRPGKQLRSSGRPVFYTIIMLVTLLMVESCHLGKKNCGCGMDLNGAVRKKHRLF